MAIEDADIGWYLSGGDANADPDASLGGEISSTAWTGGTLHDLFDLVTGPENEAEESEHRCIYVVNEHGTLTWERVKAFIESQAAGGAVVDIGLDPEGLGDGSATGVATTIADEDTAPAGVNFSGPTDYAGGLDVGDMDPAEAFALWVRRTTANTGPLDNDNATLAVQGDTAE